MLEERVIESKFANYFLWFGIVLLAISPFFGLYSGGVAIVSATVLLIGSVAWFKTVKFEHTTNKE